MTQTPVASLASTIATLPDFAEGDYAQRMMVDIGRLVNLGLPGINRDIDRWLSWMLAGGTRPKPTLRAMRTNGTNAYYVTQDVLCATLDHYLECIDWKNSRHFALVERATRPAPGTTPLN